MKKLAFISVAVLALTGCATSKDYQLYAETQQKIAQAQAMAETARYAALAEIAKSGDTASRVAAVMSLNMNGGGTGLKNPQQVTPPKSFGDTALQWTSVLLPSLTQIYGINANRQVAITQSNNQAAVARSTNETFAAMNAAGHNANVAISGQGFTAVTGVANAGLTAVTGVANAGLTATTDVANTGIGQVGTTAGAGLTAATNISTAANTAITNVSNASNTSIQTLSNQIPNLQPNVTNTTTTTTTTTNNTTTPTTP